MLPATHRMRHSAEFEFSVRSGRRSGRSTLVAHFVERGSDEPARVGFVVSRAVGNAVERNGVRRRLRHLVRDRIDRLPAGSLLVVRALPKARGASRRRLAGDLDSALTAAVTKR